MAASKPLIFDSVTIGANTYELTDSENIEIPNEAEKLTVDAAQEIISSILSGLKIPIFDLAVLTDAGVLTDSDVDPATDKVTLTLNGAAGSSTVSITGVYVTGVLMFDRPSPYVQLSAQKRGSGSTITLT